MILTMMAFALATNHPLFSARELRSLPCGWRRDVSDVVMGGYSSHARIVHGVLTVEFGGADDRRTIFLIVDGIEQRIAIAGPITVTQRVTPHKSHKVVFGLLLKEAVIYASAACLQS
jgi:hypothetical protein